MSAHQLRPDDQKTILAWLRALLDGPASENRWIQWSFRIHRPELKVVVDHWPYLEGVMPSWKIATILSECSHILYECGSHEWERFFDVPRDEIKRIRGEWQRAMRATTACAFLPVDADAGPALDMLSKEYPLISRIMWKRVKQGVAAVPYLLQHLTDKRQRGILVEDGDGEFRYQEGCDLRGKSLHVVTSGDLCYITLGQILNCDYDVARYQPREHDISIASPTGNASIAKELRAKWKGLTPDLHQAKLVADLLEAEDNNVRIGAAKRLAYYYPGAVTEPALALLKRPVFNARYATEFVHNDLLRGDDRFKYRWRRWRDAEYWRPFFEQFLEEEGEVYRYALQMEIFAVLERKEASNHPDGPYGDHLRDLLVRLFGMDRSVTSKDRPKGTLAWRDSDLAAFLREGLSCTDLPVIDEAIYDLLLDTKFPLTAIACINHLVGRGFDNEIEDLLRQATGIEDAASMFARKRGWTRLHLAVERKHIEHVEQWIASGKDVNATSRSGDTPLHVAAASGNTDLIAVLLKGGATLDRKNRSQQDPLQLAVKYDHPEAAQMLLAEGAIPADMLTSAFASRADLARRCIECDPACVHDLTEKEWTSLHLATWKGSFETVSLLLRHGANPNAVDVDKWTPLHLAVHSGLDEIVRLLLDHKANISARTRYHGHSPLTIAVQGGYLSTAKILVERNADPKVKWSDDDYSLLHIAAREGHLDFLPWLLKLGLRVNERASGKHTALHHAVKCGRADCVEYLLQRRANVNATNINKETPLFMAISGGHVDVVRILLKHGATTIGAVRRAAACDVPDIARLLRRHVSRESKVAGEG